MRNQKYFILFVILNLFFDVEAKTNSKTTVEIDSITFKEIVDISARTNPIIDGNRDACALIKLNVAPLPQNFEVEGGGIFKLEKLKNEYRLWMLDGSKKLSVKAKDMLPREIEFSQYGYPSLKGKNTYQMNISCSYHNTTVEYNIVYNHTNYRTDEVEKKLFISYQYEVGYPLGLNIGYCGNSGLYVFVNYVNSDIKFAWEDDEEDGEYENGPTRQYISAGIGPMFRLNQHFYLQTGLGLTTDGEDSEWYFLVGGAVLYNYKSLVVGAGYYYNGASAHWDRNVLLDGLTLQLGLAF